MKMRTEIKILIRLATSQKSWRFLGRHGRRHIGPLAVTGESFSNYFPVLFTLQHKWNVQQFPSFRCIGTPEHAQNAIWCYNHELVPIG